MATVVSHLYCFILSILIFISDASLDRRFSDFKRCADEECSMLLCRGKASNDFSGPDCRFLSFKKGETIYVYYKLSGQRSDVWAGSVGSRFGYFPKDLLTINHIYTEKEIEARAEETDFVCFDTGMDKFESYDIDQLLSYSESHTPSEDASVESAEIGDTQIVTEEVVLSQNEMSSESDQSDEESELSVTEPEPEELPLGPDSTVDSDDVEVASASASTADSHVTDSALKKEDITSDPFQEDTKVSPSETSEDLLPKDEPEIKPVSDHVSEGVVVPELNTTLGHTFDAVISEDEDTLKVTSDSEEATNEDMPDETQDEERGEPQEPPLLSYTNTEETHKDEEPSLEVEKEKLLSDLINHAKWDEHGFMEDKKLRETQGDEPFHRVREAEHSHADSEAEQDTEDPEDDEDEVVEYKGKEQEEEEQTEDDVIKVDSRGKEQEEEEQAEDDAIKVESKEKEQDEEEQAEDDAIKVESKEEEQDEEEQPEVFTPKHHTPVDPEVPNPDVPGDAEPLDDKLIFEEEGESDFVEYARDESSVMAPSSQDDKVEEEKKDDPIQSPMQPQGAPSKSSVEAKSPGKVTALQHDNKIMEQIAKAKKELTGVVDSWGTQHVHYPSQDEEEEPTDLGEEPFHEELLEDENAMLSSLVNKQEEGEKGDLPSEAVGVGAIPDIGPPSPAPSPLELDTRTTEESPTDESSKISDAENNTDTADHESSTAVPDEPEYSDSVLRLTLIRDHFKDQDIERLQKFLDLKHLFRIEVMFNDLEQELKSARLSQTDSSEDIERTLEAILESSETYILDEIEKMLDTREQRNPGVGERDSGMLDEEATILDDFQELAFTLRQKYSAASDSVPLVAKAQQEAVGEDADPYQGAENSVNNLTVTEPVEGSDISEVEHQHPSEPSSHSEMPHSPDLDIEEDGGHRNKDSQASPSEPEEIQRGPQAILENPLDVGFGFEVEHPSSGSVDHHISDLPEDGIKEDPSSTSVLVELRSTLQLIRLYLGMYAEVLVASLPEEWRPGPTFHGLPWEPVVGTVAVGLFTVMAFFWKTVLAVRSRTYQLTEKQLADKIRKMLDEKSEALAKISELKNQEKEWGKQLKDSQKSQKSLLQENEQLKKKLKEMKEQEKLLTEKIKTVGQELAAEEKRIQDMRDTLSKSSQTANALQQTVTSYQNELAKVQVLMDEAKLREDALKAEMMASEKENATLKELKNNLQISLKESEEKHKELHEKIKVFQKSQKDLEDALAHKENEIDIMTDCIAELRSLEAVEADDSHGDKGLANGEASAKKNETMKAHIRQMMDVSRVKATLSVIEDERNRFLEKLLDEERTRLSLEEQIQKLEHTRSQLENDKHQLENQHKNLEQKLEIMSEMYQQKENALHQKLTREELDRREKESKLSEVDRKTLKAEEEVEIHKRRIQEMEDEMQKSERSFKAQIAALEKKAHDNWLSARAAERTLVEEKRESATLRQKLMVFSDKIGEQYRHLPKPTPGRPDRTMRRGDSYGPSPVSGGAPSPPLMIEGPGRPPSAPVGRRSEPLGPRPPSDPHGRYPDLGYPAPPRPDMYAPRTSSPTDASLSKSQGPGSLLVSPIRDSPAPNMSPKGLGPPQPPGHPPMGPAPPNGLPPPMMRPNGHPQMMPPGPMPHEPRFGPPPVLDPRFGPPVYGPRPVHPYGPPPPPFMRGPPPLRDYPPMGPPYGQDFPYPPRHLPPGAMLPPPGAMPPPPHGERDFRGPPPALGHIPPDVRNSQGEVYSSTDPKTDSSAQQTPTQDTTTAVLDP